MARNPDPATSQGPEQSGATTRRRSPRADLAPGRPESRPPIAAPSRAPRAGGRRARPAIASLALLLGLLALLLLAAAIVAVVLITAPAPTKVMLRNVVYSDVQQTSSALKQLVLENTK